MSLPLFLNASQDSVGLVTYTYTIPASAGGMYTVHFEATVLQPSSLVVLVKNNGSTVFTAPVMTPTQEQMKFDYTKLYAAADAITVVMSSAAANDNLKNSIKSICHVRQGE